jgi:hypothetical protein
MPGRADLWAWLSVETRIEHAVDGAMSVALSCYVTSEHTNEHAANKEIVGGIARMFPRFP